MNEAEAHVLRDIIRTTIREAIAHELAPIRKELEALSGLPQTTRDLTDEVLALRLTVGELTPQVARHADRLGALERALREVEPTIERLVIIAGETVPQLVQRIEHVAEQVSYDAERRAKLAKSVERLEEDFDERERISSNGE